MHLIAFVPHSIFVPLNISNSLERKFWPYNQPHYSKQQAKQHNFLVVKYSFFLLFKEYSVVNVYYE